MYVDDERKMSVHPLETHYDCVLGNVALFSDTTSLTQLGNTSKSSDSLRRKMNADELYWKRHFEAGIGKSFTKTCGTMRTTWREKVRAFEKGGAKGLLLSRELFDIQLGCSLLSCGGVMQMSADVVSQALFHGDEDVIRYMATRCAFYFAGYAERAFIGDLYVNSRGAHD